MSNITEKVKSFEDALAIAGAQEKDVIPFKKPKNEFQRGLNATAKLMFIADVLNEGWIADWNNRNQEKYYPWFYNAGAGSGFAYGDYRYVNSRSSVGSRLAFKSSELAEYAGEQFLDIYNEFLIKQS